MHLRGRVVLKSGREGPVRGGNPWIFSQAIARVEPHDLQPGEGVTVHAASGGTLGFGYYNSTTTIAVRMLAFDEAVMPERIVDYRVGSAIRLRRQLIQSDTNCHRLINGEGDGLPGVVVDRYADVLVLQILTAGAERLREEVLAVLDVHLAPRAIIERSQGAVRRQEGLSDRGVVARGSAVAEVEVVENGIPLVADLEQGQKTGYFLDQRENRLRVRSMAQDTRVLDLYCYSGGFTLNALAGGAREVVAVDSSARALDWGRRNLMLSGYDDKRCKFVQDDAGNLLASVPPEFNIVVIDPPPLARSHKDAPRAARLYVELNAMAMRAVAPGGSLFTFSCSTHFRGEDFIRAVRMAQSQARQSFRLIEHLGAGRDHPTLLGHPESEYLTGLWLIALEK